MNRFFHSAGIFLLGLLLISCSTELRLANGMGGTGIHQEGLGGTGKVVQEGLGGTGQIAQEGIGGTGKTLREGIGGTGIVGTITGFGSIWVNKAHVHFNDATPVTINQQAASASAFKLGQVVSLLSDKLTNAKGKSYQARSVDIVYEALGPVASIGSNQLIVLNQPVLVDQKTIIADSKDRRLSKESIRPNNWVAVSGYRKPSGEIRATRIDVISPREKVELIGPVQQQQGKKFIFNQPIEIDELLADASQVIQPNSLRRVLVVGRYVDGMIQVERVDHDSIQAVIEAASDLIWEGFIQEWDDDFYIYGIEIDLDDFFEFDGGELFILEGAFEEDEFVLDEIYEYDGFEYFEEYEDYDEYEEY